MEEEARLRAEYKIKILAWRKKKSEEIRTTMGKKPAAAVVAPVRGKKVTAPVQQQQQQQPVLTQPNNSLSNAGMSFGFGQQQGMLGGMGGQLGGQLGGQFVGNHFGGQQQQQPQQQFYNSGFQGNALQGSSFQGNPAMYQAFQMHPQFAMQNQQMMGGGNLYGQQGMQQGAYNGGYGLMGFSSGFDAYGGTDGNNMYLHPQHHDGN